MAKYIFNRNIINNKCTHYKDKIVTLSLIILIKHIESAVHNDRMIVWFSEGGNIRGYILLIQSLMQVLFYSLCNQPIQCIVFSFNHFNHKHYLVFQTTIITRIITAVQT